MAYQALYRQWRPQDFSSMVGQEAIIATLRNQIMTGRIAHAYLFCGSRGTGKTSTAKIMARAINCLHPVQGGNAPVVPLAAGHGGGTQVHLPPRQMQGLASGEALHIGGKAQHIVGSCGKARL